LILWPWSNFRMLPGKRNPTRTTIWQSDSKIFRAPLSITPKPAQSLLSVDVTEIPNS
jgi:hypothetical protein